MNDRRRFIHRLFGGMAAAIVLPASGSERSRGLPALAERLQHHRRVRGPDEAFWELVKEQFPLREELIIMNAANLCPAPYPVIDTVVRLTGDVDADATFQNRAKFGRLSEQSRALLAAYLGADTREIAITRNTSEGNNVVINGLTLGSGDEVVIWDQNHPTNNIAWDVRAKRYGYTVKRVATPVTPTSETQLADVFIGSLGPRTRVLSFSHVSNVSGIRLPAKELCRVARERDVLTLIDGAQTFGAERVDLHDLGCDFYTGSAHKWFVGPKEAGVLYVRNEAIADLWPSNVGVGWTSALENGARKFDNLGQRDDAAVAAMGTATTFHNTIGVDRIADRVRELATHLKTRIAERLPDATFTTPMAAELSGGVVVFAAPGLDPARAFPVLYEKHNIGCARRGAGLRFCPHMYNTIEEVERVVEAVVGLGSP